MVPLVEEPPVAPKPALAPSEKLDFMLSAAREVARFSGETVAALAARATPPRPDATPAAPDWPREPRLYAARTTRGCGASAGDSSAARERRRASLYGQAGGATCGKRRPADRKAGTNGGAGAELRPALNQAGGDAGTEDAETQQGKRSQHDSHGVVDRRRLASESGREL